MNENKSKISNTEWFLVISFLFILDLLQVALDWMLIGFVLNPFLDGLIGMSFAFYLQMRGESLANGKRAFGIIATFIIEMVPGLDELPLWGLDGLFNFFLSRQNGNSSNVPFLGTILGRNNQKETKGEEDDTEQ